MGEYDAIRIRKHQKSVTVGNQIPALEKNRVKGLLSKHLDKPSILSSIFNYLA